jgi:hypothetical protein
MCISLYYAAMIGNSSKRKKEIYKQLHVVLRVTVSSTSIIVRGEMTFKI